MCVIVHDFISTTNYHTRMLHALHREGDAIIDIQNYTLPDSYSLIK